jgi:O-methyltransferase involved in polyketide biosynthesis
MSSESTLTDVPETMLWTLHNRAVEAMRDDGIIQDEKAIEIYRKIDYDYEQSFGKAEPSHAIRSLDFDREIRDFLDDYPNATIVNLGEGLETQRFRIESSDAE